MILHWFTFWVFDIYSVKYLDFFIGRIHKKGSLAPCFKNKYSFIFKEMPSLFGRLFFLSQISAFGGGVTVGKSSKLHPPLPDGCFRC